MEIFKGRWRVCVKYAERMMMNGFVGLSPLLLARHMGGRRDELFANRTANLCTSAMLCLQNVAVGSILMKHCRTSCRLVE
ncbi:hypothetical protein CEXT_807801 [Caerostris extrusa]|uniref:Uncharacterized protein n=1 Tax=Caerostris extrusa TaxID=172846 RepID=A0AAV4V6A5_CAEEX|nr:hypothetical protein CEXT_807801 [Caerostris extrusa]